ncbi:60S ribosomal protein L21-B [Cladophialophora yegresii CBS 114405]|uniref:60S ribosomal protein L21-B n=1 Tax=Cladophialophora yegresii CBS 114405 TaxID=1182544 RepID=W9W824_9EURO|nr:60S ribosomal protein L21-B [Cladophialophora yegresii CBS 114405]EXJ64247.1 60S ribosomal protein L21-B [Cladophialophora yegresii CBS 114405]
MGHSAGLRSGTRYAFSRQHRKKGMIALGTYMKTYRVGDIVDIKANGAVQKGMPYKVYHGKTGVIYNVTKSAVGVIVYKKVGNRYMEKRVNVRVEHIAHSRSREEFLTRVKSNAQRRREAKEKGESVQLKRMPQGPRGSHTVDFSEVESLAPQPYDTHI